MFKVHEKYNDREEWIRSSEIMKVYRTDDEDYTVIVFINGEYIYVTESVEVIVNAIDRNDNKPLTVRQYSIY